MIRVEELEAKVGTFHLGPIDLRVPKGEIHALLGPSGSGKSTLLRLILGLQTPQKGKIFYQGEDITCKAIEDRSFGYLPQHLALFPHLNVKENLRYSLRARNLAGAEYESHLRHLIEATGIDTLLDRNCKTLSGGERQRVALVRALAAKPKLLLLDEPFSALDPALRHDLWHLTRSLQEINKTSMLLITHDMQEAFALAKRLHLIIDGSIRQVGTPSQLWESPLDAKAARYLGVRNFLRIESCDPKLGVLKLRELTKPLRFQAKEIPANPNICAIRPESIEIVEQDEGVNHLKLPAIAFAEPSGTLWRARLPNGGVLEVRQRGIQVAGEKRELSLRIPPDKVLLYP